MLRLGWLVLDEERRTRGQVYHLKTLPARAQLELIDDGFELRLMAMREADQERSLVEPDVVAESPVPDAEKHLETLIKEIRLAFLSAMGEAERYKQLFEDNHNMRDKMKRTTCDDRDQ